MSRGERQADIHPPSREGRSFSGVACPIRLFARQEGEIIRLTQAINQAPRAAEKAVWAQVLIEEVDLLLECEQYDESSPDCRLCRQLAELRRKTAALIVRAGQLQERRQS